MHMEVADVPVMENGMEMDMGAEAIAMDTCRESNMEILVMK